jgi:sigma-B regulation protein RsbU (phosphoserine phosphatase)
VTSQAIIAFAISCAALALLFAVLLRSRCRDAALALDNPEFQDFAGSLGMTIMVIKADMSAILYASPGFRALFGMDPAEASYARIRTLVHEDDLEALDAALLAGRRAPFELEFRIVRDGEGNWIHMRGFPIARRKAARRIVLWMEDRSRRKSDELKLAQARDYEVAIGARIQQALLLGQAERDYASFDLASMTLPSQKIDGDFIDFFDGADETLDLMLGDVMGKGIPAALTGAAARNAFVRARMSLADTADLSAMPIKDIVGAAEQRIAGKLIELKTFFTLVYGRVDGNAGLFRYVDCGHTSVIHYEKRSGRCWRLKGANAPIGFLPKQDFQEYAVPIAKDDLLFFYSDGITEATDSEGEQFGEDRLMKLIRSSAGLSAAKLLEKIKLISFAYAAGDFKDDITGISVKINAETKTASSVSRNFPQSLASLHAIRDFFGQCIAKHLSGPCSEDTREALLLAAGEAISNVVKHNAPDQKHRCAASFILTDAWAAFTLYYHGQDYDWQEWTLPNVKLFQTGGYGLYIIGEIMDSVTVSRGEDGLIRLSMLFHLKAGKQQ